MMTHSRALEFRLSVTPHSRAHVGVRARIRGEHRIFSRLSHFLARVAFAFALTRVA